jgi:hypothetical protein
MSLRYVKSTIIMATATFPVSKLKTRSTLTLSTSLHRIGLMARYTHYAAARYLRLVAHLINLVRTPIDSCIRVSHIGFFFVKVSYNDSVCLVCLLNQFKRIPSTIFTPRSFNYIFAPQLLLKYIMCFTLDRLNQCHIFTVYHFPIFFPLM